MFIIFRPSQLILIPIRKKFNTLDTFNPFSHNTTYCQHYVTFVCPLCPVILQSFERNTYSGSRYIRLFKFWSGAQIIHLPQKGTFFVYLSCPIILQSFQISATADLRCSLRIFFFEKLGAKLILCPRRVLFGKFHSCDFCLPIIPY